MKRLAYLAGWSMGAFLAGCATLPPKQYTLSFIDCTATDRHMAVTEYTSNTPGIDCPRKFAELGGDPVAAALWLIGLAASCALWDEPLRRWGVLILPPWATDAMRAHEVRHLTHGNYHPALLPFLDLGCGGA